MIDRLLTRPYLSKGWYFRLTLLIGQSLSLGVTLSLLIITANSLFLVDFGPEALPYVYITVAFAGSILSYGTAALQRRWALPKIAMISVASLAVFLFLSWLGVVVAQLRWVSFALIVSFSVVIQIGFVFLGGQAGRLLDLRQIKRLFPQVVAGFIVGYLLGALAIPFLVDLLGGAENVILAQVVSTLVWLLFILVTSRRFPEELYQVQQGSGPAQLEQSFLQLLRKPYVLLIFVYHILAAIINQLSDFFLLAQSAERYSSSESLAQFFSRFTAGLNVTDLLVTTLIAGLFLSRFGLGAGLLSNPLVMGILFLGMVVIVPLFGADSSLFFLLVIVARVANISLTDGTTRASVNTAYQALPGRERGPIQTGVEGIGVPLGLGLVGVILLVFNAIPGLTIVHLVVLAAVVAAAWVVIGLKVYRDYKSSLVKMIRRQALDEADFSLEDLSTLEVVSQLLQSDKLPHVRQALDILESAEHDSLDDGLVGLLSHPSPEVRSEALARIERRRTPSALEAVKSAVSSETDPQAKAAALRALCALEEGGAVEIALPYLEDEQAALQLAAMVGLLRYGGISGVLASGERLLSLGKSPEAADRVLAARVIGEVGVKHFHEPLLPLLEDSEVEVRRAALLAAGKTAHAHLLDPIIANLSRADTRSVAAAALTAFGDEIPLYLQGVLAGQADLSQDVVIRLLRVSGQVRGEQVVARLKDYIDHPDDEIRHQLLTCLSLSGWQVKSVDEPVLSRAIRREVEQGLRILLAHQAVGEEEGSRPLLRALLDDLAQVRQRIFLLLSFRHDPQTILRTEQRLSRGDESERALAFEILEVSLPAETKSLVFPILEPNIQPAQRIERLGKFFPQRSLGRDEQLQEIIANPSGWWQNDWIRACAIYAAGRLVSLACIPAVEAARECPNSVIKETANWALDRLTASP